MPDYYFTALPQSEHKPASFTHTYRGHTLQFATDSGVFSRLELDKGTDTLLNALPQTITGRVLDMGCGYGALGVSLAKANPDCVLTMADINERAVMLAKQNAEHNGVAAETMVSDGYSGLQGRAFDLIVTNPPIRAGKRVIYRMFADGAATLAAGGAMVLVIRKQQGAPSAKTYLETLFQQVEIIERSGGFWVLRCEKPLNAAPVNPSEAT